MDHAHLTKSTTPKTTISQKIVTSKIDHTQKIDHAQVVPESAFCNYFISRKLDYFLPEKKCFKTLRERPLKNFIFSPNALHFVFCSILRWPIGVKHNSISLLKHNNVLENTTIFPRTKQSFRQPTKFPDTQQSFSKHNKISKYW